MRPAGTVVVADDLEANLDLFVRLLVREGYVVYGARDGAAALELVMQHRPDLVLSDVMMPKLDGFELCRRIKGDKATRLTPVVLVTSLAEREDRIEGINAGADDFLTKPVNAHELQARVRSLVRLKRYTDDLDSADSVILSLGLTVEARDPHTGGHCERMASYAAIFGQHLQLGEEDIAALHRGGYLHDVGKVGIPDSILLKPGPLTPDERVVMESHTVIGDALCGDLRLLRLVRAIVRHHHEHLDGSGYPDGLSGDAVPLLAQIMGIVDIYDAMTTDRVYRKALAPEDAYAELQVSAANGWHSARLVEEFIGVCRRGLLEIPHPKSQTPNPTSQAPHAESHVWRPD
jgi:putative two-component system response regulator